MGASAAIALGVALGGQSYSAEQQRKAARRSERRQREANRIQKATADVERSIARKRSFAQARAAQAANIASAINMGVGGSLLSGAQSSIGANLGTSFASANRSFVSQQETLDLRQQAANIQARSQRKANEMNAVTNLATTAVSFI